jgi:hypothetical protein
VSPCGGPVGEPIGTGGGCGAFASVTGQGSRVGRRQRIPSPLPGRPILWIPSLLRRICVRAGVAAGLPDHARLGVACGLVAQLVRAHA